MICGCWFYSDLLPADAGLSICKRRVAVRRWVSRYSPCAVACGVYGDHSVDKDRVMAGLHFIRCVDAALVLYHVPGFGQERDVRRVRKIAGL